MTARDGSACPPAEDIALLTVWTQLHAATRQLSDTLFDDIESETGLAPSSFQALWFLYLHPERSAPMSALGRVLGFSTAGITKLTDRLVESQLISRVPSADDRRMTLAALSERGARTAESAAVVLVASIKQVVSVIGDGEFGR